MAVSPTTATTAPSPSTLLSRANQKVFQFKRKSSFSGYLSVLSHSLSLLSRTEIRHHLENSALLSQARTLVFFGHIRILEKVESTLRDGEKIEVSTRSRIIMPCVIKFCADV
jgi:hypothetical protein